VSGGEIVALVALVVAALPDDRVVIEDLKGGADHWKGVVPFIAFDDVLPRCAYIRRSTKRWVRRCMAPFTPWRGRPTRPLNHRASAVALPRRG
jgi:hypothetical protein